MTDITTEFIVWELYFNFIGVLICSVCCAMCKSEWHEERIDSSQIPECHLTLDRKTNGKKPSPISSFDYAKKNEIWEV